jgi:hypothetical protein
MHMPDVTRRGFLTQVSVATGIGLAGGLGLHKVLLAGGGSPPSPSPSHTALLAPSTASLTAPAMDSVTLAGPMLVHVRDLATAEVAMMVGTQELVYRDPELVSRLVRTAVSASGAEG